MGRPRKPRPMKWHVFVGRRRLDVEEWLKATKLRSYDALCTWCKDENILPPSKEEMKGRFGAKRVPKVPESPEQSPQITQLSEAEASKKAHKQPKKVKKAKKIEPEVI